MQVTDPALLWLWLWPEVSAPISAPSLGTSIHHMCSRKTTKKKKKKKKKKKDGEEESKSGCVAKKPRKS